MSEHGRGMSAVALALILMVGGLAGASCSQSDSGAPPATTQPDGAPPVDSGPTPISACTSVQSSELIPQRTSATVEQALDTFANLSGEIEIQCGNCHKAPAQQGGFSYDGTRDGFCHAHGTDGRTPAQMMIAGLMPKGIGGQQALGRRVQAWIDQGCPADTYKLPLGDGAADAGPDAGDGGGSANGNLVVSRDVGNAMTDLGSCIPTPDRIGRDAATDARFAAMHAFADLPAQLSDTDVVSLDASVLASHGTVAYAPAYPLWSDDAKKLRLVHVPAGQSIAYDAAKKHFVIPPNTRFYKTFFKAVVEPDGVTRFRKMETRIIVTRQNASDAIFGSYVWNTEETAAKLLGTGLNPDAPGTPEVYLNGQKFPDYVRPYQTNETNNAIRSYAVPGRDRCVACHTGSEGQNFILGFTPIQINRRPKGQGGLYEDDVLADQAGQAQRLISYGVVTGVAAAGLPKLEDSALPRKPRTDDELRMQAYMLGNCTHCHNPHGYAVQANANLRTLDMSPGGVVFGFDFTTRGSDGNAYFPVNPDRDPTKIAAALVNSNLYRRVVLPTGEFDTNAFQGFAPSQNNFLAFFNFHMPQNVPAVDCRLPALVGRWWASLTSSAHADAAEQRAKIDCQPAADINWVLEDTTERYPYVPRNINWAANIDGWIKALSVTSAHESLAKKTYYQGYFRPPKCAFPTNAPPPVNTEPWMFNQGNGQPLRPWSELYAVNPGEHIFAGICANCHGVHGDAQTGAARALRATTGARVASFVDGLFGPRSNPDANLGTKFFDNTTFDSVLGLNGAAKYLVWMANGGTTISFGRTDDETTLFFSAFVTSRAVTAEPIPLDLDTATNAFKTSHANMLKVANRACNQIRTDSLHYLANYDAAVASKNWDALVDGDLGIFGVPMWQDVCLLNNPLTDAVRQGDETTSIDVQNWLNVATFNAGAMVYIFLRDELSKGTLAIPRDQCELKYPTE